MADARFSHGLYLAFSRIDMILDRFPWRFCMFPRKGLLTSTVPKILRELTVDDFKSQARRLVQERSLRTMPGPDCSLKTH